MLLAVLMTFNVMFDSADDDATLRVIERENADVVCLQEVTPRFAKRVATDLAKTYPYRVVEPRSGTWGLAILSKRPIVSHELFAQRPHAMPALEARIALDGDVHARSVRVVCTHLFPPGAARFKSDDLATTMAKNAALRVDQAKALVARLAKETAPIVLLGDMNEGRDDAAIRALVDGGFVHSCAGERARCAATFPGGASPFPALFEIDHVLGRNNASFRETHVAKGGGSDHFAVVATLALGDAA